jgi:hypothetical protein
MSLTLIAGIVTAIGAVAGVITWFMKWRMSQEYKDMGRMEAKLDAAEREAGRAKDRQKIEAEVRGMGDTAVNDELRAKWQRD